MGLCTRKAISGTPNFCSRDRKKALALAPFNTPGFRFFSDKEWSGESSLKKWPPWSAMPGSVLDAERLESYDGWCWMGSCF